MKSLHGLLFYKLQFNSLFSIMQRISGFFLIFGLYIFFIYYLFFSLLFININFNLFLFFPLLNILLLFFFCYHFLNGLRIYYMASYYYFVVSSHFLVPDKFFSKFILSYFLDLQKESGLFLQFLKYYVSFYIFLFEKLQLFFLKSKIIFLVLVYIFFLFLLFLFLVL